MSPMHQFIDRRRNPKDKSLGNRQRFIRRARAQIKEAVEYAIKERQINDVASGETISIPTKGIGEPTFRHSPTGGVRQRVLSGNRNFVAGDRIKKPESGDGLGKEAASWGEGEDVFVFTLTGDEFLDLFFDDLKLPHLMKTSLKDSPNFSLRRVGFTTLGTPTNLDVTRTMRNSLGRRIALDRPPTRRIEELQAIIVELESETPPDPGSSLTLQAHRSELESLEARRRFVGFIDPMDVRYRRRERRPKPIAKAAMFCLMDVSGSMGEREKDLAKRFFMLLHLFLKRRYEHVDLVFIRHTHEAQEVNEETFFYGKQTGGTVVSTALAEMDRIMRDRYPADVWNIYAAQASDGENLAGDSERCARLLEGTLLSRCQYFAYVEILDEREMEVFKDPESGAALWLAYRNVKEHWPNFEMKRIARPGDIYPVLRELLLKRSVTA